MTFVDARETFLDGAAELVRLHRHGPAVLTQDPRRELLDVRVLRDEDVALEAPRFSVDTVDPPGGVVADLESRLADDVANLPGRPSDELVDVELRRDTEVALAARCETNVAADARDPKLLHASAVVEIGADDVPDAEVRQQRVGVERPFLLLVARDREVRKLDRPLLRDRALELAEPTRHLHRVVRVQDLDANRCLCRRVVEAWSAEREVLQREPQRFGVRELSLQQVERGLECRELVVLEVELRQEVVLGAKRVELFARELVALRLERDAEREQLGPV